MAGIALTRRGRTVLGICFLAVLMAVLFGSRSLNAVVIPGVVALVAGYYQLSRLDTPGVRRDMPPDDFVGATHKSRLEFTDPDSHEDAYGIPFLATIREELSDGLSTDDGSVQTTVGSGVTDYTVEYTGRGKQQFGPLSVTATDIFGLFERELKIFSADSVLVYPERRPVPVWFRRALHHDEALGASRQREEFDRLREYARGDALRDIHWSATAKQEELIVKEFAAESEQRHVTIAGGTKSGAAASDSLAEAIASIALALLDDGIPVVVSVPDGQVKAQPSHSDRRLLLELLAVMSTAGGVPDTEADVTIQTETPQETVTVRTDSSSYRFEELVDAVERNNSRNAISRSETAGSHDATSATTDGGTTAQIGEAAAGGPADSRQTSHRQQSRVTDEKPSQDSPEGQGTPTPGHEDWSGADSESHSETPGLSSRDARGDDE